MYCSIRRSLRRFARPATVWTATIAYVVVVSGVPIPLGSLTSDKDRSEPFPCMNSRCGCQNADQCWRNCCCHSVAERLAWARSNGVSAPDYLSESVTADGHNSSCEAEAHKHCDSCGSKGNCCHADDHEPQVANEGSGSVVLIRALACRGASLIWLSVGIAIPIQQIDVPVQLAVTGWLQPLANQAAKSVTASPPIPPPRSPAA